jgi:hypothetical protein
MAITIDFLANVRQLLRGTTDVEEAFEDVSDSLDDMARDGDAATEKLERSFKSLADESKRSGDKIGTGFKDGTDKAKAGLDDFKDEANSTAKESAASFDGSAESIAGAFQEVAANAFAGFGPAGAIAGLAAAAGIGLAVSGFDAANEASEEAQQAAADWAQAYIDAGTRILGASQVIEGVQAIVTDPDKFKDAKDNAREWGVSTSTALLAMAGDANALAEAQEGLRRKDYEYRQQLEDDSISKATGDFAQLKNDLVNGEEAMKQLTDAQNLGASQADAYSESLRLLAENTAGATSKVDEFGDTVYTLPDGKQIYIDAETGKATENTDAIEQKIFGIPDKTVKIYADTASLDAELERIRRTAVMVNIGFEATIDGRRGRWIP